MLLGFNTNFRHRGVLFHVQTEDSGTANPHVITHLFHGGNILASEKREYSEKLGSEKLEAEVKALMELQHKDMLKRLRAGVHDAVILQRMGPNFFKDDTAVEPLADGGTTASSLIGDAGTEPDLSSVSSTDPLPDASASASSSSDSSDASSDPARPPSDPPQPPAPAQSSRERMTRAFGEGVVSQKPLDEVVLEYLVESARKRKRSSK